LLILVLVAASYRQVVVFYTRAGGSYVVARENFGPRLAQIAAAALLIDYVVTPNRDEPLLRGQVVDDSGILTIELHGTHPELEVGQRLRLHGYSHHPNPHQPPTMTDPIYHILSEYPDHSNDQRLDPRTLSACFPPPTGPTRPPSLVGGRSSPPAASPPRPRHGRWGEILVSPRRWQGE
jgi:hypothetical protein